MLVTCYTESTKDRWGSLQSGYVEPQRKKEFQAKHIFIIYFMNDTFTVRKKLFERIPKQISPCFI